MNRILTALAALTAAVLLAACGSTTRAVTRTVTVPQKVTTAPPSQAPETSITPSGPGNPSPAKPEPAPPSGLAVAASVQKHIDVNGLHLIEGFEGWASCVYWDAYGRVYTRGYGETEGIHSGSPCISRAFGEANLRYRVERFYEPYLRAQHVTLNQNQWDAGLSFMWNLGAGIWQGTTIGAELRAHNFNGVASSMLQYVHAGGVVLAGLVTRRRVEATLFLKAAAHLTAAQLRARRLRALHTQEGLRRALHANIDRHHCRPGQHAIPRRYHTLCGRWLRAGQHAISLIKHYRHLLAQPAARARTASFTGSVSERATLEAELATDRGREAQLASELTAVQAQIKALVGRIEEAARVEREAPSTESYGGYSASNPMTVAAGSSTSPFNQAISSPAVLPNSSEIVSYVLSLGSPMPGNATSGPAWKHPTVFAKNSDPLVELRATEPWGTSPLTGRKVHVPAAAQAAPPKPSEGGDAHLEIVLAPADAKTPGETAEMWRANPPSGGVLRFAWGGTGNIAGTGAGGIGATAAGFDLWAGQVRGHELKAGVINHALCLVIRTNKAGSYVWPADHTDGRSTSTAAPKEGQRFQLNYSDSELAALPVKPWKRAILTALAHYGGYDCDSGGPGLAIELESSVMFTAFGQPNPFAQIGTEQGLPAWEGETVFHFSEGVNWGRLRVIAPPAH